MCGGGGESDGGVHVEVVQLAIYKRTDTFCICSKHWSLWCWWRGQETVQSSQYKQNL